MFSYFVRRLLLTVPVLLGVATLVFALIHLIPGDPAQAMLGESASPQDVAVLRARLGLDRPIGAQYAAFVTGLTRGDFGTSLRTNQPVRREIASRVPATFELALAAMLVAIAVALPLGILGAVTRDRWIDHAASAVTLLGISVPNFWLGPMLAIVFAVMFGWLPVSGRGTWAHTVLPALTLATPLAASLARTTRASMIEELRALHIVAARARGLSPARVVLRHALWNGLIPVVTVLGLQVGMVLTGAVVTETIFAWPGVGRFLVQSIAARDYPAVQGCVLFIAVVYVGVNLVVDATYGWLDPRVRPGEQ
jgi:ABC-type dipeptide/oligopeptide/nickel transport system permease component